MKIIEQNLNWNGSLPDGENKPQEIVLHHAEASSCSVYDVHSWHLANGWAGIGYHYFIRKDGTIYRGRKESWRGAHCPPANYCSIGICFEGDYTKETMPQTQINAGLELITDIKNRYGFKSIYGHRELYSTECPGDKFPLDMFKNNNVVNKQIASNKTNSDNGGFEEMKTYRNGSTPEPVYADTNLTMKVGCLDPWETCNAVCDIDGRIGVLYNTPNGKKLGFTKYRGGL